MLGELRDEQLSKQSGPGDTAADRTERRLRGDHAIAAVRAGILGQDVDINFKVSRDEIHHTGLILADACLVFSAARANLLGLGHIMLKAYLRQAIKVRLPRSAWFGWCSGITGRRLRCLRWRGKTLGFVELEEMPLPGGLHQSFPSRTENIAAVELDLLTQFVNRLVAVLNGLIVELGRLIKCGPEIFGRGLEVFGRGLQIHDLLSELAQQVVTLVRIGGP